MYVQPGKHHENLLSGDRDENLFGEAYYDILFSMDYIKNLQLISLRMTVDYQKVYKNMSHRRTPWTPRRLRTRLSNTRLLLQNGMREDEKGELGGQQSRGSI